MSDLWPLFLSYVLPVLSSILMVLVTYGISLGLKKLGIEVDLTNESAVRFGLRKLIGAGEEWAANKLKVDTKPEGKEKLAYVLALAEKRWPKMLPDDLERLIHEELAGSPGVGATGDTVIES